MAPPGEWKYGAAHRAGMLLVPKIVQKSLTETSFCVARLPLQQEVEAAVWPEKALEYEQGAKRTGQYFAIFCFP